VRVGGLVVVKCLTPGDESKAGEGLGLEFESEVEVLERVSSVLYFRGRDRTWTIAYTPNGTPPGVC
jgi:hypothetical protein